MTYIIAEPCVGTCDTACVEVCPVDCIHGPDDKKGAGAEAKACEPECPVEAIFEESEVPEEWSKFTKINYDWFGRDFSG